LGRLDGDLETAQELKDAYRFDEALATLRPIAALEDSRLREFAARARERVELWKAEREVRRARAQAAEDEARQWIAKHEYQRAMRVLEAVPGPIRTEGAAHLLDHVLATLDDIASLDGEMDSLVRGPLSAEALRKVGRLLTLCPNHREGRRLAARFSARLLETAEAKLADCRYAEVKRILDQIAEPLQTDALRAVRDRAWELHYLAWDLSSAPILDEHLLGLAKRFRRLAPHDNEIGEVCNDLQRRFQNHKRSAAQPVILQTPPPAIAEIGYPLEWGAGLGRIEFDPELDPAPLMEHPGRFAVACGAALQGLDAAAIDVNLLPDDEGLLRKAARWLTKRPARTAWGLDLGSSGLKAVKLALGAGASDAVVLQACDVVEYEKVLSQAASEGQQRSCIEGAIRQWLARNDPSADRICLTLPPRSVLVRQFQLPAVDPDKLDAVVEHEALGSFPLATKDLEWRYAVLEETEAAADQPAQLQVAVLGVRRVMLKEWLATIRGLGLKVDAIQTDWLALHNFAAYGYFQPQDGPESEDAPPSPPVAILDIGADATGFLVSGPRSTWFRAGGFGVDRVTKTLVREFHLTFAQAEQWMRDPAAAVNTARVAEAIRPVFNDLGQEIKTALGSFEQTHPGQRVERVLVLGGGCLLHGLLRHLWRG
jgi:type IV pilus assembly protein PilM